MPIRTGSSHLRYDHQRRPTLLEVGCPKCHGKAVATEPCYAEGHLVVGEGSCPHWETREWSIGCLNCSFRNSGQSYSEVGEFFYRIVTGSAVLWAWNREHLLMLYKLVSGKQVSNDRYACFATYAERDWLKGSQRKAFAKAIQRRLKEEEAHTPH